MSEITISGVIAILTRPDGTVMATAMDCDESRPGGFSREDAQTHRARRMLAREAVRRMCNDDVADVMGAYESENLLQDLCRAKGYVVTVKPFEETIARAEAK